MSDEVIKKITVMTADDFKEVASWLLTEGNRVEQEVHPSCWCRVRTLCIMWKDKYRLVSKNGTKS